MAGAEGGGGGEDGDGDEEDDEAGGLEGLLALAKELGPMPKAEKPGGAASTDGRRTSQMPLIEVARTKTRDEAMAALDEWRAKHPETCLAHI